jgi:enamine deaminase RidA (YjgF/YER057c/UK114 family)
MVLSAPIFDALGVMMKYATLVLTLGLGLVAAAHAETPLPGASSPSTIIGSGEDAPSLRVIPSPGGAVYLPTAKDKSLLYDTYTYAPARRAGNLVFLSGVIAGPLPGEGHDVEAFKNQLRRCFQNIVRNLAAAGARPSQIVEIESYHVFPSPGFSGDWNAHLNAVLEVKNEFIKPPYPTWTVLGVAALAEENAVVEIKVTAYAPPKR